MVFLDKNYSKLRFCLKGTASRDLKKVIKKPRLLRGFAALAVRYFIQSAALQDIREPRTEHAVRKLTGAKLFPYYHHSLIMRLH